jgi:ABC-2 type transport system ATP-binding protein
MNVVVDGLSKHYGDVRANDEVSFEVAEGEVFGYLGPNGAGKTTTIRALMGFQSPTSGTASVLGADVHDEDAHIEARERIGFLPADPVFDDDATGREILDLHESLKGGSRRAELTSLFDAPLDREIRGYSTGQRQKLGLVQAFMHDPDLVILDEPTAGLDPLVQRRFNDFVRDEKATGTTVFLSSHVLSEVRRVCDRIAIIRDGRIVAVETVADLLERAGKFVRVRVAGDVATGDVALDGVHGLSVQSVAGLHHDPEIGEDTEPAGVERENDSPPDVAHGSASTAVATEVTFTYTGSFDDLVDWLGDRHLLELDVEEAPLEQVFMRFYDDEELEDSGSDGVAAGGEERTSDADDGPVSDDRSAAEDRSPTQDRPTSFDRGPGEGSEARGEGGG